ncbi:hypothetical protein YC2023_114066 [Brassica napus]
MIGFQWSRISTTLALPCWFLDRGGLGLQCLHHQRGKGSFNLVQDCWLSSSDEFWWFALACFWWCFYLAWRVCFSLVCLLRNRSFGELPLVPLWLRSLRLILKENELSLFLASRRGCSNAKVVASSPLDGSFIIVFELVAHGMFQSSRRSSCWWPSSIIRLQLLCFSFNSF